MRGLKGRVALITGASSGIGRAIAIRFASEGARVVINYRSQSERAAALDVLRETGGQIVIEADVSREDPVRDMVAKVVGEYGRLDILINNAGIQEPSRSHEVTLDSFNRVLGVNLHGAFLCCREAIQHFLSRPGGGVIVNNTSAHEVIPKPLYLSYSASKGALENMTRTLALEYADRGIRVNSVGPGAVVTPLNSAWTGNPAARGVVESHIPMGRAAEASEIAGVFAFLASDEASYITGQTIFACGGLTLFGDFRTTWAS